MTEPTTEAGRRLLTYGTLDLAPNAPRVDSFADVVLAIEAEARATRDAELRKTVERFRRTGSYSDPVARMARDAALGAVLALLAATPSRPAAVPPDGETT
jgi:hypothetical protein